MKKLLFLLAFLCSPVFASVQITSTSGWGVTAVSPACADFKVAVAAYAVNVWHSSDTVASCSADPVFAGATFVFANGASGSIASVVTVCASGTHLDAVANICVDDVGVQVTAMPFGSIIWICGLFFAFCFGFNSAFRP